MPSLAARSASKDTLKYALIDAELNRAESHDSLATIERAASASDVATGESNAF